MALSCFDDRESPPTGAGLDDALGETSLLWSGLIAHMTEAYPPIAEEWAFAGASFGWSLRLVRKKRRLLYLIPQKSFFLVGIVLGDKAVAAAFEADLPARIKEELSAAKRYAEGRGIRVRIASPEDLNAIMSLAEIKARG
jgi:hypothetical protein